MCIMVQLFVKNVFIFVVDNIVQLHDINGMNLNTLFVIERSKGATYFAVHTEVC